jgi:hypothetical protein
MPKFTVRKASEVPPPSRTSNAIREQQQLYEGFIRQATGNVGELTLEPGDAIRSLKVKLRRSATRIGRKLDIWDMHGKVYFQAEASRPRRGRSRKIV